jgi:hypothetical protein
MLNRRLYRRCARTPSALQAPYKVRHSMSSGTFSETRMNTGESALDITCDLISSRRRCCYFCDRSLPAWLFTTLITQVLGRIRGRECVAHVVPRCEFRRGTTLVLRQNKVDDHVQEQVSDAHLKADPQPYVRCVGKNVAVTHGGLRHCAEV